MKLSLDQVRQFADKARTAGKWEESLQLYAKLPNHSTNSGLLQNQAICFYALKQFKQASELAQRALKLLPSMWQASLINAKCHRELGDLNEWARSITELATRLPDNPDVMMEYASVAMTKHCDPKAVQAIVAPFLNDNRVGERARFMNLMNQLYDRDPKITALVHFEQVKSFVKDYLYVSDVDRKRHEQEISTVVERLKIKGVNQRTGKKRIGFISGLFTASPVYFLAIDAIKRIASEGHELVFFSRKHKVDWATKEFKCLAQHWVDCADVPAAVLEAILKFSEIDELFDMAGWTDTEVLKALASKPATLQFKWVGGQSCSTGMNCFDGYITDIRQTIPSTYNLYTEPLVSLGKHYVNYTPPPYMPASRFRPKGLTLGKLTKAGAGVMGVAANPIKISTAFLGQLNVVLRTVPDAVQLRFIDWRFSDPTVQKRIMEAIDVKGEKQRRIIFIAPKDHPDFLNELNQLDLMFDTFPYSGGLTVCEAKHLQVPIHLFAYDRRLFCERHSISHLER